MKKANYREASEDYRIKTGVGSIYIVPQDNGLLITARPSEEAAATALFGEPTGRYTEDSMNYAKWFIPKR